MASEAYDKALQLDGGNARAQSKLALIKDLFGTGNKTTVAAAKPSTMPIRPADKKVEAAKPVAEKQATDGANDEKSILDAANNWAAAWASKDLDKYFASYADSFKPAKGESRKAWEATRKERINRPAKISVDLSNQKVTIVDANNAKISFKQSYRADGKPIGTHKTLIMKKVDGAWLIDQEIASN
jgi:ketosteroid isomerase-like protein